jgi:hypothetical protein
MLCVPASRDIVSDRRSVDSTSDHRDVIGAGKEAPEGYLFG